MAAIESARAHSQRVTYSRRNRQRHTFSCRRPHLYCGVRWANPTFRTYGVVAGGSDTSKRT